MLSSFNYEHIKIFGVSISITRDVSVARDVNVLHVISNLVVYGLL